MRFLYNPMDEAIDGIKEASHSILVMPWDAFGFVCSCANDVLAVRLALLVFDPIRCQGIDEPASMD